jgi:hypothetical protein
MEKEPVEKAAKSWVYNKPESNYYSFIAGAEWQAERMYSQEEVLEHLNKLLLMPNSELDTFTDDNEMMTNKWFEHFKKN